MMRKKIDSYMGELFVRLSEIDNLWRDFDWIWNEFDVTWGGNFEFVCAFFNVPQHYGWT